MGKIKSTKPRLIGIVKLEEGKLLVDKGDGSFYPVDKWAKSFRIIGHIFAENLSDFQMTTISRFSVDDSVKRPEESKGKILITLTGNRTMTIDADAVEFAGEKVIIFKNDKKVLSLTSDVFVSVRKA